MIIDTEKLFAIGYMLFLLIYLGGTLFDKKYKDSITSQIMSLLVIGIAVIMIMQ